MSMHAVLRLTSVLLIAAGLLMHVSARAAGAGETATLTGLPPAEQVEGKPLVLGARLNDATTGKAIGNAEVEFFVMTEVFGPRLMRIGSAVTDTTGRAAVSYRPSWEGETQVVARFAGNAQYAATEGSFEFASVVPVLGHQNSAFGLEPIRAWAPVVVILLVVAVWAALIAVVMTTVAGLRPLPSAARVPLAQPASSPLQAAGDDISDGAS
jgi:hypothetical protein